MELISVGTVVDTLLQPIVFWHLYLLAGVLLMGRRMVQVAEKAGLVGQSSTRAKYAVAVVVLLIEPITAVFELFSKGKRHVK